MTDWIGIELFSIIGGVCGLGIIIVSILERVTLPKDKITESSRRDKVG